MEVVHLAGGEAFINMNVEALIDWYHLWSKSILKSAVIVGECILSSTTHCALQTNNTYHRVELRFLNQSIIVIQYKCNIDKKNIYRIQGS